MKHLLRDSKGRFAKVVAPILPALLPMVDNNAEVTNRQPKTGTLCETCKSYKGCILSVRQDQ